MDAEIRGDGWRTAEIPDGLQREEHGHGSASTAFQWRTRVQPIVFTRIHFAQVHFSKIRIPCSCPPSSQLRRGRSPLQCFIPLLIKINCSQLFHNLIRSNRKKGQCICKATTAEWDFLLFVFHLFFHFQAVCIMDFLLYTCLNHQEWLLAPKCSDLKNRADN